MQPDSQALIDAYTSGGTCRPPVEVWKRSLIDAGFMEETSVSGFPALKLTKAGQKRAKELYEAWVALYRPRGDSHELAKHRAVNKNDPIVPILSGAARKERDAKEKRWAEEAAARKAEWEEHMRKAREEDRLENKKFKKKPKSTIGKGSDRPSTLDGEFA